MSFTGRSHNSLNNPAQIPGVHKQWAQHLRATIGDVCAVTSYLDEAEENRIHIFTSQNKEGVVAATVGLMDINQSRQPGKEIYSEVLMDQRGHDERIANILSTIAFYIRKDGWKIAPGVIFESMVEMFVPETRLPHVMFVSPFQWDGMSRVLLGNRTIHPLLAIPISEAESEVAKRNQGRDLEDLWERQSVDFFDWGRVSSA